MNLKLVGESDTLLKFVGDMTINSKLSERLKPTIIQELSSTLTVGNLEAPVTYSGKNADKWAALKQPPSLLGELRKVNVSGVSLANNHMFDYGAEGLRDTFKNLKKNDIPFTGAGNNLKEALSPIELNNDGSKIRIYSLATTLPLESAASNERPGVAPIRVKCTYYFDGVAIQEQPGTPPTSYCYVDETDLGRVKRILRANKKENVTSIITIHWGMPYQYNLMDYQKEIAHALIDAGADLIIGHHPHVLQQMESYKEKLIFYSLGNFIWQPSGKRMGVDTKWNFWPPQYGKWGMSQDSAIVEIGLSDGEVSEARVTPVFLDDGIPNVFESQENVRHELFKNKEDFFPKLDTDVVKGKITIH